MFRFLPTKNFKFVLYLTLYGVSFVHNYINSSKSSTRVRFKQFLTKLLPIQFLLLHFFTQNIVKKLTAHEIGTSKKCPSKSDILWRQDFDGKMTGIRILFLLFPWGDVMERNAYRLPPPSLDFCLNLTFPWAVFGQIKGA